MHYEDLIRESAPDWPYPVNYGKENEVSCDVLVPAASADCWTAISAARKGAKVVLVDKGATGGGLRGRPLARRRHPYPRSLTAASLIFSSARLILSSEVA